jgi:hypothetical protein
MNVSRFCSLVVRQCAYPELDWLYWHYGCERSEQGAQLLQTTLLYKVYKIMTTTNMINTKVSNENTP